MASNFLEFIKRKKELFVFVIVTLFILVWLTKIVLAQNIQDQNKEDFAYQQAKILSSYVVKYREHYQSLFIDKTIPLDKDTIHALPAVAIVKINELFSKTNPFSISIKTVSDQARNPSNQADKFELDAIKRYKVSPSTKQIFEKIRDNKQNIYQYTLPLWVEQSCLKCHFTKESAPEYVSDKYNLGYDYKLGELRGVISIKIPQENIDSYFYTYELLSYSFEFFVFIILLGIVFVAYKILNSYNIDLEEEVSKKTLTIQKAYNDINQYKNALNESSIVTISDKDGIIKYVNDNFVKTSGFSKEEAIGKTHSIINHPDVDKAVFKEMWESILAKQTWKGTIKNKKKNGGYYVVDATVKPILDLHGEIIEFIAIRHDITAIYDKQNKIEKMVLYDELTSLQNRKKLLIDIPKFHDPKVALFDIDNFSNINDFYGNSMGDFILKELAKILKSYMDEMNGIYRYTSDRFILLSSLEEEKFLKLVESVIQSVKYHTFIYEDLQTSISLSVAISFEHKENLLNTAEMTLKELKRNRLSYLLYDKSFNIEETIKNNIYWTSKIKKALEEDRFVLHYQAIYNNHTQKIEKYESLVRMIDEDGSLISPFYFLEFAKLSKQYINITKIVINHSFEKFKDSALEFSLNLTIEDIQSEEIRELINSKMQDKSFWGRVVFEIVESEGIENSDILESFIQTIKSYQCKIAIDDFGTGYSNFIYLLQLSPDYVKIDGSMIKNIDSNIEHFEIVKTIIEFAKIKNIQTIAEFVCSKEVYEKILELGIDFSQGYYIAKPSQECD
ncbi:MAG: EAL domain-containing protein [Arcobacteraceae bacterium]|nr:EAL domain-containing protein [Arcobacteraceae bacterium]